MFGIFLTTVSTFFEEASSAIGKDRVERKEYSLYTFGWIQSVVALIFFILLALFRKDTFIFSLTSVPTFMLRVILEVALAHITRAAIVAADRSTFSFVRTGTILLVLAIDWLVGYRLTLYHFFGIGLVIIALFIAFSTRSLSRRGLGWVIISAVIAALTISLFKFDITNYNSVVAEQLLVYLFITGYFTAMACWVSKERPWKLLRNRAGILQALFSGFCAVIDSFAYLFAAASVIIAARRSSAVLWSILTGRFYFKESYLAFKLVVATILTGGIILLGLGT